jgi:hypothetical protein
MPSNSAPAVRRADGRTEPSSIETGYRTAALQARWRIPVLERGRIAG